MGSMMRSVGLNLVVLGVLLIVPLGPGLARAQAPAPGPTQPVDAKVELVWPHDPQGNPAPVAQAPLVNVEVYLFRRGTLDPVGCDFPGTPRLHYALNWETYGQGHGIGGEAEPDEVVGQGLEAQFLSRTPQGPTERRITRTAGGEAFPVWVFDDVPIGPGGPYVSHVTTYFFVDVPGYDARTNVWAHGADPRTFQPNQVLPERVAAGPVAPVEARIQVVWPHDRSGAPAPAGRAPLANVAVDLFRYPYCLSGPQGPGSCGLSVAPDFAPAPELLRSLDAGYLEPVGPAGPAARPASATLDGRPITWPRWELDDVDVSAAASSSQRGTYYFAARVPGVEGHTTIWAHGADARTSFPRRDVPTSSGAGC